MAKRGSDKARSVAHEDYVAGIFGGKRSASSGASPTDLGDVRTWKYLIECRTTGDAQQDSTRKESGKPVRRSTLLQHFEKITEEAYADGHLPMVALRFWAPESILAREDGWVDLVVQKAEDVAYAD